MGEIELISGYEIENADSLRQICGPNDANIPYLEQLTGCRMAVKGNRLEFTGSPEGGELLVRLLDRLVELTAVSDDISGQDILMEFKALDGRAEDGGSRMIMVGTRTICPKGIRQTQYVRAMESSQVIFAVGPAGTGKTFLATNWCLGELLSGRKNKIVITRPVVEAGENLGFLPGDLSQKLNPYLKPLYDSMEATLSPNTVKRLEESGQIEIAPLAYMRGRSLNNACVILDEAQNTTVGQMKMFLTRLGENSCAIITGDITQTDLPHNQRSGLVDALERLEGVEGVSFIRFSGRDTVRSRIVQRIISAYEK